ncbi:MAG TPA: DNA-directed RNA polymerase subunit alpha C-terminal domain-containing protein [Anaerolineales bacterium]|nr:DNA-directed RNA polymerase subunit alpha C-terminal domain-containing protein [Anaerolineales bacterium]
MKEELRGSPERPIEELGLSARAIEALKKAGIENFGQFLEKLNGGNDAVLSIAGFGQASLTAAKKKLRSLGYEIPAAAA